MLKPFLAGLAAVAAAVAGRYVLNQVIDGALPFVTAFAATAVAQWYGERRVSIPVAILSFAGCVFLLPVAPGQTAFAQIGGAYGIAVYAFTATVIIAFGEAARSAERRAHDRGETLHVTLASIGDGVITTDVHGRVTTLNPVAEALTGWTQAEAAGQPLATVFHIVNEDTRATVESPTVKALRDGVIVGLANHTLLVRRDGSECPIDDSAAPIRDGEGRITGSVLIFRDVTPQRERERERAAQLRTARLAEAVIQSSDDAIVRKRLDGTIEMWNPGAERLCGSSAGEAVGRHISLIIPPDRLAEEDRIIATLRAGRRIDHFETERVCADGSRRWVSLTISPIADEQGNVIAASKIVRDVTERRHAEVEREKFVNVLENSQDFIGMCDLQGVPFFVNRAGLAMVGLDTLEDAKRTPVAEFFFPEDRDRILNDFLPQVLRDGRGEVEVRFRHFKTGEPRWMAYKVVTLPDLNGKPIGFATVSQDVTERKALADDLRRLASSLSDADRRKNEFLALLAHELRNPLAPISNAVRAIRLRQPGDEHTVLAAADMLERHVAQMARLVNDLLDASRISRGKIELRRSRVAIAGVVEEALETVRPLANRMGHQLSVSLPPEPVYIDGDAGRLAQVIGNLLNNACKFTNRGGHIALDLSRAGTQAVICVRDDGIGIAADDLPGLFDMFVQVDTSLERSRDGLGIGLTLVKTLVELHGGSIEVHSEGLGRGSEFIVRLPVAPAESETPRTEPPMPAPPRASRRVLVVDDNVDAAESLAMLLTFSGHEARQAHDGAEALKVAEEFRPDVVLLDIGLPVMNGYEACRRLRQEPWARSMLLVALTGWGQEEDREQSRDAGFDVHLVKPVDHEALLDAIARSTNRVVS
jgi:PAS domain S-box-containing protein